MKVTSHMCSPDLRHADALAGEDMTEVDLRPRKPIRWCLQEAC